MPPTHDDAICLRHREWSETSQTVTLLSRTHGLVHGIAKGSYREKAPFSGGFEHLQLGELGFINKPDRDLVTLTDWDLTDPFPALRTDYRAATIAMLAAELTASLLAPFDPHPGVFDAFVRFLMGVAGDNAEPRLAVYLLALLDDTGHAVAPPEDPAAASPDEDAVWAFDPESGSFAPDPERRRPAADPFGVTPRAGVWHVRGETLRLLALARDLAESAGSPQTPAGPAASSAPDQAWSRLARFLVATAVYRSARRPASLDAYHRVTRPATPSAPPAGRRPAPPRGRPRASP